MPGMAVMSAIGVPACVPPPVRFGWTVPEQSLSKRDYVLSDQGRHDNLFKNSVKAVHDKLFKRSVKAVHDNLFKKDARRGSRPLMYLVACQAEFSKLSICGSPRRDMLCLSVSLR